MLLSTASSNSDEISSTDLIGASVETLIRFSVLLGFPFSLGFNFIREPDTFLLCECRKRRVGTRLKFREQPPPAFEYGGA